MNGYGISRNDISMSWELGVTMNINGQGMRSYDISMDRELGATMYQWVGN
jgi:hypothetical protein